VSAYRGYCQGNGNMLPTTVDEVLEVLFKVVSGLILAVLVIRSYPKGDPQALPMGSAAAIFGVSVLAAACHGICAKTCLQPLDKKE
jgi:stage V sporulation protein B